MWKLCIFIPVFNIICSFGNSSSKFDKTLIRVNGGIKNLAGNNK